MGWINSLHQIPNSIYDWRKFKVMKKYVTCVKHYLIVQDPAQP